MILTPPPLDKDNDMGTISTMTKGGNAFTNAVPCYLHFTESTKNLPRGHFANDVHLMLCHHASTQWACLQKALFTHPGFKPLRASAPHLYKRKMENVSLLVCFMTVVIREA